MVLSGKAFGMKASLATGSVNGLTGVRILTAATLATWTLLLTGCVADDSNRRCYVCGPQNGDWSQSTPNPPPPCENFTDSEQFAVECGDDYNFCAITATPRTHVISRMCSKNVTENCSARDMDSNMTCICSESLCNGDSFAPYKSKINSTAYEGTTNKSPMTTDNTDDSMETTTIMIAFNDHNELAQMDPTIINNSEKPETVTDQSNPQSLALGQEITTTHQKGAPVDDEEDNLEGSGNDQKINMIPTTTQQTTTTTTAATQAMKSDAPANRGSNVSKLLLLLSLIYYSYV